MPGGWPIGAGLANATDQGTVTASSRGTNLTTGAANTKGSYVQLVASTANDTCWCIVTIDNAPAGGTDLSVDIAVGGAGSEVIVASDLKTQNQIGLAPRFSFPLTIPAGTRIAARAQSTAATTTVVAQVTLLDAAFHAQQGAPNLDTYGFASGTTLGTQLDPGATANTKGAYAQLTASTTNDLAGFFVAFDINGQSSGSTGIAEYLVDVSIGAAASEKVILPNIQLIGDRQTIANNACYILPATTDYLPIFIPAGTRLSARCQCSINTATARLIGITFYGVRA